MVTPMLLDLSSDSKYEGYRYEKGQTPVAIDGSGSTVFRIYYDVRKPVSLTVNKIKVIIDADIRHDHDEHTLYSYRTCDNDDLISASGRQKIQSEDKR